MTIWTANFYETIHGVRPVEVWLDSLTEQKFAAMDAAILLVLQPKGLTPGDTKWLTACGSSSTSMERKSSYFFTAMTKQEMTTNETNNIKSIWHENGLRSGTQEFAENALIDMMCKSTYSKPKGGPIMTKKYEKYSAERRARLSPDGTEAIEVFSHAFAMGSALIEARQERSLTQRALADLSGVQQADISRMERGILAPTTSTLMRLVEALDGRLIIELKPINEKGPVGQPVVSAVVSPSR